jgi:hypothetical protein
MKALLLCPGPSLAGFDDSTPGYRVGVNRAAVGYRCDTWAALDYPTIRDQQATVIGSPLLFTRRQTWLDVRGQLRLREIRLVEDLACPVKGWDLLTATTSLVLLADMGAKTIDVYGADWAPDALDFDGKGGGENRSAERFARERETWTALCEWLAGRGVTVTR